MAEVVENPPKPCCVDATSFVIDDHARSVGDPEATHQSFEHFEPRKECGWIASIAERVVEQIDGTGDVSRCVVDLAAAAHVDDADSRICEVRRQPRRVYE